MTILAIDTAFRSRVVVVVATREGEQVQGIVLRGEPVGALLPRALLSLAPLMSRAVVVVTGPGTYTGVRAGMAGALGIAQALDLPLHGIGSLEVCACAPEAAGRDVWVLADAGRGAMYVARRRDAAAPRRVMATSFDPGGAPMLSTEPAPVDGLVLVDPLRALAASVAPALSRPPLDRAGLIALYVD